MGGGAEVGVGVGGSQGRWQADASAANLFARIGLPDFPYYSAGDERAAEVALQSWPLLGAVVGALRSPPVTRPSAQYRILEVVSTSDREPQR